MPLSRPARARGLKLARGRLKSWSDYVAPRAGAWIETSYVTKSFTEFRVAPRAGAWIETDHLTLFPVCADEVAPRAGAWIETVSGPVTGTPSNGRAPRGRVD